MIHRTFSNYPIPYPRLDDGYIPFEAKSFKNGEGVGASWIDALGV